MVPLKFGGDTELENALWSGVAPGRGRAGGGGRQRNWGRWRRGGRGRLVRQPLLVLQLGQAPAQRQHAAAEVAVCRELTPEVFRGPTVEQVATAGALSKSTDTSVSITRQGRSRVRGR